VGWAKPAEAKSEGGLGRIYYRLIRIARAAPAASQERHLDNQNVDSTTVDNRLDLFISGLPVIEVLQAVIKTCRVDDLPGGTTGDGPVLRADLVLMPSITGLP
jgi:hypothetical protein